MEEGEAFRKAPPTTVCLACQSDHAEHPADCQRQIPAGSPVRRIGIGVGIWPAVRKTRERSGIQASCEPEVGRTNRGHSVFLPLVSQERDEPDVVEREILPIRARQAEDADVRSPRAYLTTIVTRLCIDHLRSRAVHMVRRAERTGTDAADWDRSGHRCRLRSTRTR